MIVGNQLTPFMSRYSKIVVRQSIVSHDNFLVSLFYSKDIPQGICSTISAVHQALR